MSLTKSSRLLIFLLLSLSSITATADIYLSKEQTKNVPMKQAFSSFNCNDTIYAVIEDQWPEKSEHLLEAYWYDPQGKQREHTRYKFIASRGETRSWIWLRLHQATPDLLDRLLMQENDSLREFNGRWKVVFYLDGKKQQQLTFQLSCG